MTVNDMLYNGKGVVIKTILLYHEAGFIIIPLGDDRKTPAVPSTKAIYDNPSTPEGLRENKHLFKNIATLLGKTHLKDADGRDLYLNILDIEDKKVYDTLAALRVDGRYFLDDMPKTTFVIKTRKKWGLRIYWLSHEQNPPIGTKRCKFGYKFEIKTDNTLGHSTLLPSRHRDDEHFRYQSIGQEKLAILDGLYHGLLNALSDCLRPKKHSSFSKSTCSSSRTSIVSLSDRDIEEVLTFITPTSHNNGLELSPTS